MKTEIPEQAKTVWYIQRQIEASKLSLAADALVVSARMYNFCLPSVFGPIQMFRDPDDVRGPNGRYPYIPYIPNKKKTEF